MYAGGIREYSRLFILLMTHDSFLQSPDDLQNLRLAATAPTLEARAFTRSVFVHEAMWPCQGVSSISYLVRFADISSVGLAHTRGALWVPQLGSWSLVLASLDLVVAGS